MKNLNTKVLLLLAIGACFGEAAPGADATRDAKLLCHSLDGRETELHWESGKVSDLKVQSYSLIKKGKQLPDQQIGQSVFDVRIQVRKSDDLRIIHGKLRDYGDVLDWEIQLNPSAGEAILVTHLITDCGDGLQHLDAQALSCAPVR